ncbi:unnamed protein product [Adineta steineri]|uniref:Uncharacterized protein n=1 Tax=Adineta steineri TaxID=433720 RepID=A0A818HSK0_9BILA|nr:unnamed protein product [Adineta steineri]CAF3509044.1 unnamed protein product [Adineta steineri]
MSSSGFTTKFFHPSQRTVSCNNGLLDIRTKHIIAKDRLNVAEQRILDIEERKSASNIQLIALQQKRFKKKFSSHHSSDQSLQKRKRSISDSRLADWHNTSDIKLPNSLNNSNSNLSIPSRFYELQRRFSACFADDILRNHVSTTDTEISNSNSEEEQEQEEDHGLKPIRSLQPPTVAIIPPEEDDLPVIQ